MRPYIEAGATHIVLALRAPYPEDIVQRLVEEVVEPLRGEYRYGRVFSLTPGKL
jgi:hypothetical protein